MARRLMNRGRRSGPRRGTFWEKFNDSVMVELSTSTALSRVVAIVTEGDLDNVPNPTVIRIRGNIFAQLGAAANAQGDAILIGHAIMVVDAKQLAIGVTAMPLPLSSNSEDFLWYGSQFVAQNDGTTILNNSSNYDKLVVDSKAMRKITVNQVLVLVSEIDILSGAGNEDINFAADLRILFKK